MQELSKKEEKTVEKGVKQLMKDVKLGSELGKAYMSDLPGFSAWSVLDALGHPKELHSENI